MTLPQSNQEAPGFIPMHLVHEVYGIRESFLRKAMRFGELSYVKKGAVVLFARQELEGWLRRGLKRKAQPAVSSNEQ